MRRVVPAPPQAARDAGATATDPLPLVLVVDDEAPNLDTFRRCFRKNFVMKMATGAEDALALARTTSFDVAMLDYAMPGMDGVQLARELKKVDAAMPILLVTAHETLEVVRAAKSAGIVDAIIAKPWQRERIVDAVAMSLRLSSMRLSIGALRQKVSG